MPIIISGAGGSSGGGMAQVSRQVVTSVAAATTLTISAIPGSSSQLMLIVNGRYSGGGGAAAVALQFNGDGGANYDQVDLIGIGTGAVTVAGGSATVAARIGAVPGSAETAAASGPIVVLVPDYAGTTFMKNWTGFGGRKDQNATNNLFVEEPFGSWRSTAAITSATISLSVAGTFVTGTSFAVYTLA